jgi:iron(III) transport system substrate-binding protein
MKLLNGFKKKYPFLKTEIYRAGSEKLLNKILIEARSKKFNTDVFLNNAIITHVTMKKGLLAKYTSPESRYYSEDFKNPEGYWTSCFVVTRVLAYNTRLVKPEDVPKSYQDLLDPKWKGKLGGHTEENAWFPAQLKIMGQEKGIEFMKKLAEQNISHRTGRTLLGQLLAAGEFPVVLVANAHTIEKLKKQGAPVEWVPIEPVVTTLMPITLASHAPHPNAGKLFVDYVLSADGQKIFRSVQRIPTRKDVPPDPPRLLRGFKLFPSDPELIENLEKYRKMHKDIFLTGRR